MWYWRRQYKLIYAVVIVYFDIHLSARLNSIWLNCYSHLIKIVHLIVLLRASKEREGFKKLQKLGNKVKRSLGLNLPDRIEWERWKFPFDLNFSTPSGTEEINRVISDSTLIIKEPNTQFSEKWLYLRKHVFLSISDIPSGHVHLYPLLVTRQKWLQFPLFNVHGWSKNMITSHKMTQSLMSKHIWT